MLKGLFGSFGGTVKSVAHSIASVGESLISGMGILRDVGLEIEEPSFELAFEQFEGLPRLREDIYSVQSDRLIPGKLHKESLYIPKGKYYYTLAGDYIGEKGYPESAILTIRSDTRMSLDEILESSSLPACAETTVGPEGEMEWELIEAFYGA